jgi:hypothetical protein
MGATHVAGVDPDTESLQEGIDCGWMTPEDAYPCKVQDLPHDLYGQFDLVTAFLWCVPLAEKKQALTAMSELLNENGEILIGIATGEGEIYIEDRYCSPDGECSSLLPNLEELFENVSVVKPQMLSVNGPVIQCSGKKHLASF